MPSPKKAISALILKVDNKEKSKIVGEVQNEITMFALYNLMTWTKYSKSLNDQNGLPKIEDWIEFKKWYSLTKKIK